MLRTLAARSDSFALATPFRISRGVKTIAEVVTVEILAGGATGRGEGVPYPRYGESIEGALAAVEAARSAIADGATRQELQAIMSAGADAALEGFEPLAPIAADESAHVADDVAALASKYQIVNIKLDKTGGLTGALANPNKALRRSKLPDEA